MNKMNKKNMNEDTENIKYTLIVLIELNVQENITHEYFQIIS